MLRYSFPAALNLSFCFIVEFFTSGRAKYSSKKSLHAFVILIWFCSVCLFVCLLIICFVFNRDEEKKMKWLKPSAQFSKQIYDCQLAFIRTLFMVYYLCIGIVVVFEYIITNSRFSKDYKPAEDIAYYLLAFVNCYIALYIIWRYNNWAYFLPFLETTYDFTVLDRIVVYHAGVAVFFQTVFPRIMGQFAEKKTEIA